MVKADHTLTVKVNSDHVEEVKDRYAHGTLSREIRGVVDALADDQEYTPEVVGKSAEEVYHERINGDEYPDDWEDRRKEVLLRDGYECANCKTHGGRDGVADLVAHHIVPVDAGGTHHVTNLTTLCVDCHNKAHNRR